MSAERTIRHLLASAIGPVERSAARAAWAKATAAALRQAQRQMDERCDEWHAQSVRGTDEHDTGGRLSEEEFERLCDAEQAKVCAFLDPLRAAADHDRWPKEFYWGGI